MTAIGGGRSLKFASCRGDLLLTLRSDQIEFLNNRKNIDKTKDSQRFWVAVKGVRKCKKFENRSSKSVMESRDL